MQDDEHGSDEPRCDDDRQQVPDEAQARDSDSSTDDRSRVHPDQASREAVEAAAEPVNRSAVDMIRMLEPVTRRYAQLGEVFSHQLRLRFPVLDAARMLEPVTRQYAQLGESISQLVRPTASITALGEALRSQFPRIQLPQLINPQLLRALRRFARLMPDNLIHLDIDEWPRLLEIYDTERYTFAWVPRAETVREMLDAPDAAAREALLVARAGEVLDDCGACLARAEHPAIAYLIPFAQEAIDTYRDGRTSAALSLAVNVFDTALHRHACDLFSVEPSFRTKYKVHKLFRKERPDRDEMTMGEWRLLLVGYGIDPSFQQYDPTTDKPAFSRHGVAHAVSPELYRPAHGLRAILFATAMLRFLSEEYADRDEWSAA